MLMTLTVKLIDSSNTSFTFLQKFQIMNNYNKSLPFLMWIKYFSLIFSLKLLFLHQVIMEQTLYVETNKYIFLHYFSPHSCEHFRHAEFISNHFHTGKAFQVIASKFTFFQVEGLRFYVKLQNGQKHNLGEYMTQRKMMI